MCSSYYISDCCNEQVDLIDLKNNTAVCQSCKEYCQLVAVIDEEKKEFN